MWCIYILETKDGKFYTGTTNDVNRRMNDHRNGRGARFTRIFGFKKLLYQKEFPTKSLALGREKQIQGWTRRKKLRLINGKIILKMQLRKNQLPATKITKRAVNTLQYRLSFGVN